MNHGYCTIDFIDYVPVVYKIYDCTRMTRTVLGSFLRCSAIVVT